MTTSDESWSPKLRRIGEYERVDHTYLAEEDQCLYFGEYTPSGDSGKPAWSLSKANQLLVNLKKHPSKQGTAEWDHKLSAINYLGNLISKNLKQEYLDRLTFVPAPPSTSPDDPHHDQRMLQVAKAIREDVDARPILETVETRIPASQSASVRSPKLIKANIRVNEEVVALRQVAKELIVLDDMITTGSTFVAGKELLKERFGDVQVYGIFIVRRVPLEPRPTMRP